MILDVLRQNTPEFRTVLVVSEHLHKTATAPPTSDSLTNREASTITRSRWALPLALLVAALAVYVPSAASYYANPDAYASSLAAWTIATTGEPWMEGVEFDRLTGISPTDRWTGPSDNGHLITTRMYGPILAAVPFYWVASYEDEAAFSVFRGGIAASTMVAIAAMLLFLSVRRLIDDRIAAGGAAVFAFATPAWSVGADALWTHPMTMLGISGAAYGASRNRWWLVGASLGVGMLARPHLAVIAAVLGLGIAWSRRHPGPAIAVGVPTAAALGVLSLWNKYVFDSWRPLGAYAGREVSTTVGAGPFGELGEIGLLKNAAGFLFSPDRGLFVWTPILLILLPAVLRNWRNSPPWARWLMCGGITYSTLQLSLNWFGGGDGFYGYRHGLELLVCATPMFVLAAPRAGRVARILTPPVVSLQFVAIAVGAATNSFMLNWSSVWTDNSFLAAIRLNPWILVPLTVLVVAVSAWLPYRFSDRQPMAGAFPTRRA